MNGLSLYVSLFRSLTRSLSLAVTLCNRVIQINRNESFIFLTWVEDISKGFKKLSLPQIGVKTHDKNDRRQEDFHFFECFSSQDTEHCPRCCKFLMLSYKKNQEYNKMFSVFFKFRTNSCLRKWIRGGIYIVLFWQQTASHGNVRWTVSFFQAEFHHT